MDQLPLTALVGVLGVLLGAWLTSLFNTRRERWNLRRELYTRLLENLGEAREALEYLYDIEMSYPRTGNDAEEKSWEKRREHQSQRESNAVKQIRLATSVAAIMLPKNTLEALQEMEAEWNQANRAGSISEHLDIRLAATKKAYNLLVKAAREDLNFK